jgi:hypothetical protein
MSKWAERRYDRWSAVGPHIDARVRTVYRERWSRILILSGEVEGVVRYEGMGHGERVYLDGVLCDRSSFWQWSPKVVAPRIEFTLPRGRGEVPALIEVAASFLPWRFGVYRFRLSVDEEKLYDEDSGDVWFAGGDGFVTDEPFEPDY